MPFIDLIEYIHVKGCVIRMSYGRNRSVFEYKGRESNCLLEQ
jgi:hypothetical protein